MSIRKSEPVEALPVEPAMPLSQCHGSPFIEFLVYVIESDGNEKEIGKVNVCSFSGDYKDYKSCFKPVGMMRPFRSLPKDFDQDTWDRMKMAGPTMTVPSGWGYFCKRSENGILQPWTGRALPERVIRQAQAYLNIPNHSLERKDLMAGDAYQPEPRFDDEEPPF